MAGTKSEITPPAYSNREKTTQTHLTIILFSIKVHLSYTHRKDVRKLISENILAYCPIIGTVISHAFSEIYKTPTEWSPRAQCTN